MIPRLDIHFSLCQQWQFMFGKPYTPKNDEFLFNHSRSAIMLVLKATGLPAGAGVGVMAYNCHTVFNAVEQADCTPVFLDVTKNLTLDFEDLKQKASTMSALVVTHLFGIVNDVKQIKSEFPNLIIIEDCAHAYNIEQLFGDFATFSIGQGKLPSIGDGGILKVLTDKYIDAVKSLYDSLPKYSKIQSTKLFISLFAKSLMHSKCFYGWFTLKLKRMRKVQSGREMITPLKMCNGISAVYANEKEKITHSIESRHNNAQRLIALLPDGVNSFLIGKNAFMLVLLCDNPKHIQAFYRKKGIDTDTHFAHSLQWAKEFGYADGSCPKAEKLCNELLVVPTYYDVSSMI